MHIKKAKKLKPLKNRYYYQPEYNETIWRKRNFSSFMVFSSKKKAQEEFPELAIKKYKNDDIEKPVYVD